MNPEVNQEIQELKKERAQPKVEPTEQPKGLMAKPQDMVE